jgi:hypothetical protein
LTGAPKQTAKGVTRVAPFVFAVSAKSCWIGSVYILAANDELEKRKIAVTQQSRELLRRPGTKREARQCPEMGPCLLHGEYHATDGGVLAGRGFSRETYHDALPGCVGSGLHQMSHIQHLPRQGDHRRLQKRRAAAGALKEKAVIAGCSFCQLRPLSLCPLTGKALLPLERQVVGRFGKLSITANNGNSKVRNRRTLADTRHRPIWSGTLAATLSTEYGQQLASDASL